MTNKKEKRNKTITKSNKDGRKNGEDGRDREYPLFGVWTLFSPKFIIFRPFLLHLLPNHLLPASFFENDHPHPLPMIPSSPPFIFFFLILPLFCLALLKPPIRITPRPPLAPAEDHHGPLALPEPADGFEFVGVGGEARQNGGVGQPEPPKEAEVKKGRYRRCTFKYIPSSCNGTDQCDTGRLCVQVTGDPCCAQGPGECPPPIQLDVTCLKHKPINWCHHAQDCARSALCCDTGCGYNMCVERHQI